ncbi:MerR family transcriptional regulator [Desulfarculus baarsii]
MPEKKPKPGLAMRQLVQASGAPKSTILHYVDKGLLPRPVKTSPNVAYYDPQCVERLRLIKSLQMEHGLSLEHIGKILAAWDRGQDITPLVELNKTVFGPLDEEVVGLKEFCRRTGLSAERVAALREAGLLLPLREGRFDGRDLMLGAAIARALGQGLEIADLTFYAELGRQIVNHEVRLRQKLTHDLPFDQDVELTKEMVLQARLLRGYVIDRHFQLRIARARGLKHLEVE